MGTETMQENKGSVLKLLLDQNAGAPGAARAALAAFCDNHAIGEPAAATVALLVSEVVTNAVVHPDVIPTNIRLFAQIEGGVIRVEVTDAGDGFEPESPRVPKPDHGYGLFLVDKQSSRWGVQRGDGTTVWFEVPTV
jgi:anti-sigma regulatory factor (Ser/Thr protein kinase)